MGTEMFHFPTFPPHTLYIQVQVTGHDSSQVSPFGHPRITARLPTPQGLSQAPTSFIGSRCQGIHHVPFIACRTHTNNTQKQTTPPATNKKTTRKAYDTTHNATGDNQISDNTHPPLTQTGDGTSEDARVHYAKPNNNTNTHHPPHHGYQPRQGPKPTTHPRSKRRRDASEPQQCATPPPTNRTPRCHTQPPPSRRTAVLSAGHQQPADRRRFH